MRVAVDVTHPTALEPVGVARVHGRAGRVGTEEVLPSHRPGVR